MTLKLLREQEYFECNREERHLAAVFFAQLMTMDEDQLNGFIGELVPNWTIHPDQFSLYFEYAYLRDLWHLQKSDDGRLKILDALMPPLPAGAGEKIAFYQNNFGKQKSSKIISPSHWKLERALSNYASADQKERICKIKWAFNCKPDIVINVSKYQIICLELKLESGEANYRATLTQEPDISSRCSQTDLHQFLFTECLGYDNSRVEHIFVSLKSNGKQKNHLTLEELQSKLGRHTCAGNPMWDVHIRRATDMIVRSSRKQKTRFL